MRWPLIFRRTAIVGLAVAIALVLIVLIRWQIARHRVEEIATSGALAAAKLKASAAERPGRLKVPDGGESAAIATMYRARIERYETRSNADRNSMPRIVGPLNDVKVADLKKLADEGNARAACLLFAQIAKCTSARSILQDTVEWQTAKIAADRERGVQPNDAKVRQLQKVGEEQRLLENQCVGFSVSAGPYRLEVSVAIGTAWV